VSTYLPPNPLQPLCRLKADALNLTLHCVVLCCSVVRCAAVNLKVAQLEKELEQMTYSVLPHTSPRFIQQSPNRRECARVAAVQRDSLQSSVDVYLSKGGVRGVHQLLAERDATIEAMRKQLDPAAAAERYHLPHSG
jgi:hypothetical protein